MRKAGGEAKGEKGGQEEGEECRRQREFENKRSFIGMGKERIRHPFNPAEMTISCPWKVYSSL